MDRRWILGTLLCVAIGCEEFEPEKTRLELQQEKFEIYLKQESLRREWDRNLNPDLVELSTEVDRLNNFLAATLDDFEATRQGLGFFETVARWKGKSVRWKLHVHREGDQILLLGGPPYVTLQFPDQSRVTLEVGKTISRSHADRLLDDDIVEFTARVVDAQSDPSEVGSWRKQRLRAILTLDEINAVEPKGAP